MMAVEYYRMVLMDKSKKNKKNGYWKETNVQCTVVMVTSGRFWVSEVVHQSLHFTISCCLGITQKCCLLHFQKLGLHEQL
jgi:hypothetical protein